MAVHDAGFTRSTLGDGDAIDVTAEVQQIVEQAGIADGQAFVFVRGSTAAVTTMEHEPGGIRDLAEMLERLIPAQGDYEHNRLNHDTNSHSHQRASLIGPPLPCP